MTSNLQNLGSKATGFNSPDRSLKPIRLILCPCSSGASEMGLVLVKIRSNSIRKSEPGSRESFSSFGARLRNSPPGNLENGVF